MQTRYFHLTDFKRRENGFQVNPHLKHTNLRSRGVPVKGVDCKCRLHNAFRYADSVSQRLVEKKKFKTKSKHSPFNNCTVSLQQSIEIFGLTDFIVHHYAIINANILTCTATALIR